MRLIATMRGRTEAAKARRKARLLALEESLRHGAGRRSAWVDLLLRDHGVLRLAYQNRHQVADGLWRSAQPSPVDIRAAKRLGIATIISLRGPNFGGGDPLERDACAREGLAYHRVILHSRMAPHVAPLQTLIELYRAVPRPILIHCKSGADRAGLAAAVWQLAIAGQSAAVASRELALRYGHIRKAKTGILDAFVALYAEDGEAKGLSFESWLADHYDRKDLIDRFSTNRAGDLLLAMVNRE